MAKTLSNMLPLHTKAPDFSLLDVCQNKPLSLQTLRSPVATVVMFICNHCPFVKHIQSKLVEVAKIYQKKQISFIAINSNDVNTYPADSPENMVVEAKQHHYSFPYLYDEDQSVAKAYQAACTPDFYVFDKELLCVYRGRFDSASPGTQEAVTGKDLTAALNAILSGQPISTEQYPSMGCNIKWK